MKKKFTLLISLILAFLVLLMPWEELKNSGFVDREVYFNYVNYGTNILEYKNFNSITSYFSSEWLWHYILLKINGLIPYDYFFYSISLLTLTSMIYYLLVNSGFLSLFLLLNPLVIDLVYSQYRISLAIVLVFFSLHLKKYKILSSLLLISSISIHSSMAMFILMIIAVNIMSKLFNDKSKKLTLTLLLFGISISWILSGQIYVILSFLNDRRASYDIDRLSSSLSYLAFWFINLLFLIYSTLKYGIKSFDQKFSLVILSLISANIAFGGYSTRILAIFFPVIMKSNLELKIQARFFLFLIYFFYCAIQWNYWLA